MDLGEFSAQNWPRLTAKPIGKLREISLNMGIKFPQKLAPNGLREKWNLLINMPVCRSKLGSCFLLLSFFRYFSFPFLLFSFLFPFFKFLLFLCSFSSKYVILNCCFVQIYSPPPTENRREFFVCHLFQVKDFFN